MSKKKAVALLSGGLDSTLAVKLVLDQGVSVHALNFTSPFCTCNAGAKKESGCRSESRRVAEEFGIPIKVMAKGPEYIDIVRSPKYGYGKGVNPCVDCRIYMFRLAKKYMEEIGASFVVTGEVLGQRPMSQRRDTFRTIEKESGLEGLVLRPLCAHHLPPTIPEREGVIDREKLLSIAGRGRGEQMGLAEELGLSDYPCPSGGCLLTDGIFAKKVRDLFAHKKEIERADLLLLKSGRHFRFSGSKVVVGRDESDNTKIRSLARPGESLLEPVDFPGPVALVAGAAQNGVLEFAGGLVLKYAGRKAEKNLVRVSANGESRVFEAKKVSQDLVEEARVC